MCVWYHFPFDKFVTCLRTLTKHIRFSIELWCCNSCAYYLQGVTLPPTLTLSLPSHTLSLSLSLSCISLDWQQQWQDLSGSPVTSLPAAPTRTWEMCGSQPESVTSSLHQWGRGRILRSPVLCLSTWLWSWQAKQVINHRNTQIRKNYYSLVLRKEWYCSQGMILQTYFECDFLFILWEWKQTIALSDLMSHQ